VTTHIFGIRHHGPGCARALREALERLEPDIVLVEGPPDAHSVLPLLTDPAMKPPVALLIYAPDAPAHAVYYPFTSFSPEWQAMSYALTRNIPARFIDLPQTVRLAQEMTASKDETSEMPVAAEVKAGPEMLPAADAVAEATPGTPSTDAPT
jgi:hypothetical protein